MLSFRNVLRYSLLGSVGLVLASAAAQAQSTDIGAVDVSTSGHSELSGVGGTNPQSAPYQAPTQAPVDAIQPTSVITQQYLQNNLPPTGNYDSAIEIAPSVSTVSPNGAGLMEASSVSIRGFQDGQFNVTFDGIPWADSNDFTHHTTSYFMAHDLGEISVDRGPGTASTVGDATFGGTVSILSKDPSTTQKREIYGGYGSFNTGSFGAEYDTGILDQANGASGFVDAEGILSDGYLTNSSLDRKNAFAKAVVPLSSDTTMTFVMMYNTLHQNVNNFGATKAQIAKYGPSFALSNDPSNQNYYGYNYDLIQTDMEYVGIKSYLAGGITLDNKIYTYGYTHHGFNGEDVNGTTPNGTYYGANNVPGQTMQNDNRSFGDILRLQKDFAFGDVKTGVWIDHQVDHRQQYEVDMSNGMALNPPNATAIDRLMDDTLDTVQPYLQVDFKPLDGLTISPGIKYNWFQRYLNAPVNQGTGTPLITTATYAKATPSVSANYQLNNTTSVYAQVAQGFLAPNLNILYTTNPAASHVNPQESWNYQTGAVYHSNRLTLSGDVYFIDFSNYIGSKSVGGVQEFFNDGGVIYKGIEAEATYYVGNGFSLYANASANSAKQKRSASTPNPTLIPLTPDSTAAGGVIYNQGNIYASLLEKWVGAQYGGGAPDANIDPYATLNASLGYTKKKGEGPAWLPDGTYRVTMENLFDTHVIIGNNGTTNDGSQALYWTMPGRSIFASASMEF